jgi:hypothetical protein
MQNAARLWGLAVAGPLAQSNQADHALLGGATPSPSGAAELREALRESWEVSDRESLVERLGWLARDGHRKEYGDACALLVSLTASLDPWETIEGKVDDPAALAKLHFVQRHRERIGQRSLLAWDAGRLVNLAGWGYLTSLISEDEAWSYILPVAQAVQRTYGSWEEFGKHYLLGHEFWSGAWDGALGRAFLALTLEPSSPWRALPWGADLTAHGLAVPLQPIDPRPSPMPAPLVKKKYDPLASAHADAPAPAPQGTTAASKVIGGVIALVVLLGLAAGGAYALGLFGGDEPPKGTPAAGRPPVRPPAPSPPKGKK